MPAMLAILEVPAIRRLAAPLTVKGYCRLSEEGYFDGQRTELLRGVVIPRIIPSPRHTFLVASLHQMVAAAALPGSYPRKEDPLVLADSAVVPDVSLVLGALGDYARAHPDTALLTMEVAVTTEELDREKTSVYAEADVSEFWLVLPERGLIERHTDPRDGIYTHRQVFRVGETVQSVVLPGLQVDVGELFVGAR